MSKAKVQFLTLEAEPCQPGDKPARFTFRCVGHNRRLPVGMQTNTCANLLLAAGPHTQAHGIPRDGQNQNGGRAQWDWDGNRDSPTFSPSIDCSKHCGWHGYIKAGRCVEPSGAEST